MYVVERSANACTYSIGREDSDAEGGGGGIIRKCYSMCCANMQREGENKHNIPQERGSKRGQTE